MIWSLRRDLDGLADHFQLAEGKLGDPLNRRSPGHRFKSDHAQNNCCVNTYSVQMHTGRNVGFSDLCISAKALEVGLCHHGPTDLILLKLSSRRGAL